MSSENKRPVDLSRLDEALKDGELIHIEDSLRVVVRGGKKRFQARFRSAGIDTTSTLGIYPEMSVAEARRRKEEFLKEKARQIAEGTPLIKRQRAKAEHHSNKHFLRTERHCWAFFLSLSRIPSIMLEDKIAILLMLTMPASPKELIDAKWEDLVIEKLRLGRSRTKRPKGIAKERDFSGAYNELFAVLSQPAERLFGQLREHPQDPTYIFPTLHKLKIDQAERRLDLLLEDIWPSHRLRARDLQYTFELLAKEFSQFRPEFVEAVRRKQYRTNERHQSFYDFQVRSLIAWWGGNMERLMKMEEYAPTYGLFSPKVNVWAGPFTYPNMNPPNFSGAILKDNQV